MQANKDTVLQDLDIAEDAIRRAVQSIKVDPDLSHTDCHRLFEVCLDYINDSREDYTIYRAQFSIVS